MTPCIKIINSETYYFIWLPDRNSCSFPKLLWQSYKRSSQTGWRTTWFTSPGKKARFQKIYWHATAVHSDEAKKTVYHRADIIWVHLGPKLLQVTNKVLFLLTIPHSNAAEERVFSIIGKNKTKCRSPLDLTTLLNAIMLINMNQPEHLLQCHRWKIPN